MNKLLLFCNNLLLQNHRFTKKEKLKCIRDVLYYAKQQIYCKIKTIYCKVDTIYFSSSTIPSCEGAIKPMIVPSLPLRVYWLIRSTHNAPHGTFIMVLGGRCPYLSFCFLLTWHALHDFVIDWIEVRMPF
jgi:hypothetical protein